MRLIPLSGVAVYLPPVDQACRSLFAGARNFAPARTRQFLPGTQKSIVVHAASGSRSGIQKSGFELVISTSAKHTELNQSKFLDSSRPSLASTERFILYSKKTLSSLLTPQGRLNLAAPFEVKYAKG